MAAVIGDFVSDKSHFHNMITTNPTLQHQRSHDSSFRSVSRSRQHSTTPRAHHPDPVADYPSSSNKPTSRSSATASASAGQRKTHVSASGGASRFPSPPPSSSPCVAAGFSTVDDGKSASMASVARDSVPIGHEPRSHQNIITDPSAQQQPSPSSDDFQISNPVYAPSGQPVSQTPEQTVIYIRDLAHIQSLANTDQIAGNGSGILNDPPLQQMKYEISGMPINDIIEMVAALLTKITTTNDLQHDAMQRNATHQQQANQAGDSSDIAPLNHSVLAFHGKNVPAITILSYLSRIHKYCPTTYEVFLSLLVYFDRMTERVNDIVTKSEEERREAERTSGAQDAQMHDDSSDDSDESDSDLADDDEIMDDASSSRPSQQRSRKGASTGNGHSEIAAATYFVVDSFNIHRLIISGVTCASKFFSDVFYTNSRYAKVGKTVLDYQKQQMLIDTEQVGGLPLVELNHLELQFLLLNDFRLAVPVEDLEAYATMLVEFYAREVVAKKSAGTSE